MMTFIKKLRADCIWGMIVVVMLRLVCENLIIKCYVSWDVAPCSLIDETVI
jgi:hypothetical protein